MEAFTVGPTIALSRGLLNLAPSEAVLEALIERAISHFASLEEKVGVPNDIAESQVSNFEAALFEERPLFPNLLRSAPADNIPGARQYSLLRSPTTPGTAWEPLTLRDKYRVAAGTSVATLKPCPTPLPTETSAAGALRSVD